MLFAAPRREPSQLTAVLQRCRSPAPPPAIGKGSNRSAPLRLLSGKLLASSRALSEDRCAMNSSARSHSCARALIASVLFAAFSWTLLASVSPHLHALIHADANRSEHVCAITLITSGSYDHAAQPPVFSIPQVNVFFRRSATFTSVWVKPLFINAHIFAHAPPANS